MSFQQCHRPRPVLDRRPVSRCRPVALRRTARRPAPAAIALSARPRKPWSMVSSGPSGVCAACRFEAGRHTLRRYGHSSKANTEPVTESTEVRRRARIHTGHGTGRASSENPGKAERNVENCSARAWEFDGGAPPESKSGDLSGGGFLVRYPISGQTARFARNAA